MQVTFFDAQENLLGTDSLNPVTLWDRLGLTGFEERDISGTVPVGSTSAQVTTTFTDNDTILGNYNGAYADNESFTVGDPSLTAAPLTAPTSNVGQLDHVFLIYLENKGVNDIVGSPNAPYLNSLINTEDYDINYFALGHPSDPNYIRPWADRTSASTTTPPGTSSTRTASCRRWIRRAYRGPATRRACPPRVTSCRRVTTPSTNCPLRNSTMSSTTPPRTSRSTCSR